MRRSRLALPLVLASALVLAGCSGEAAPDPTEEPEATLDVCATPGGDAASAITVSGDFGTQPTIDFAAGLTVDETQREVLISGAEVEPGALVSVAYALYNATTGEELESYGWGEGDPATPFRADPGLLSAGFAKTLGCLGAGTRVVGVIPSDEGFGEQGVDLGVGLDDALLFVVDVLSENRWTTDLPEIGGTDDAPTVTLPATAPKTELEIAVLEEGDGDVVGITDSVTVHYLGTAWETGEIFDQSYTRGEPATFSVQGVVAGFKEALVGQKVGSRVVVTMPPALGYGEAGESSSELAGLTLVFLIDIVATAPAA